MSYYNKWTKAALIARVKGSETETHIARREVADITARIMGHAQKTIKHWRNICTILMVTCVVLFVINCVLLGML